MKHATRIMLPALIVLSIIFFIFTQRHVIAPTVPDEPQTGPTSNAVDEPIETETSEDASNDVTSDIHYHAAFQVYINDELQDFSALKYMDVNPCNEDEEHPHDEDSPEEQLHLHDGIGTVVHVHGPNRTWQDLFEHLQFDMPDVPLVTTLNGNTVDTLLTKNMQPYDSAIFFFGDTTDKADKMLRAIHRSEIEQAELLSENCGS